MKNHLNQARHNERLHGLMCTNFSDNYFDWKITCLFYIAFHGIQALAVHRKVNLGNRHHEIIQNMKPGNPKRTLTVKSDIYEAYDALFTYSWTARYDGFSDFETFQELKKYDHEDALRRFQYLKKYLNSNGLTF